VTSSSPQEQPALAACVRAAAQFASTSVPAVLRVMQDMEDDAGLKPSVGGHGRRWRICSRGTHDGC
jgi:hypothetical protein